MEHLTFAEIRSLFAELFADEAREIESDIRALVGDPDTLFVGAMEVWYPKQVQVMIEIVENPDE